MNAGKLNRRVQVLERANVRDEAGGQSVEWNPVATVWASIDIQYSALTYETSEFMAKSTYRIEMRRARSIKLKISDRLGWVDPSSGTPHIFEIEAIPPDPDNEKLMLLCYELDGNQ